MKIETIKKNKFENVKIGDKFQGVINNEIFTILDITKDEKRRYKIFVISR